MSRFTSCLSSLPLPSLSYILKDHLSRSSRFPLKIRWSAATYSRKSSVLSCKKVRQRLGVWTWINIYCTIRNCSFLPGLCQRNGIQSQHRGTPPQSCSAPRRSSSARGGAGSRLDTPSWKRCTGPGSEPSPSPRCGSPLAPWSLVTVLKVSVKVLASRLQVTRWRRALHWRPVTPCASERSEVNQFNLLILSCKGVQVQVGLKMKDEWERKQRLESVGAVASDRNCEMCQNLQETSWVQMYFQNSKTHLQCTTWLCHSEVGVSMCIHKMGGRRVCVCV